MTFYSPLSSDLHAIWYETSFSEECEKEIYLSTLLKLGFNVAEIFFDDLNFKQILKTLESNSLSHDDAYRAKEIFEPLAYVLDRNFSVEIRSVQAVPELIPKLHISNQDPSYNNLEATARFQIELGDDRVENTGFYQTQNANAPLEEILTSDSPVQRRIGFLIKELNLKPQFSDSKVIDHAV